MGGHSVRRGRRRSAGSGAQHRASGSNDSEARLVVDQNRICQCGCALLADSIFCRMCGTKWLPDRAVEAATTDQHPPLETPTEPPAVLLTDDCEAHLGSTCPKD